MTFMQFISDLIANPALMITALLWSLLLTVDRCTECHCNLCIYPRTGGRYNYGAVFNFLACLL